MVENPHTRTNMIKQTREELKTAYKAAEHQEQLAWGAYMAGGSYVNLQAAKAAKTKAFNKLAKAIKSGVK